MQCLAELWICQTIGGVDCTSNETNVRDLEGVVGLTGSDIVNHNALFGGVRSAIDHVEQLLRVGENLKRDLAAKDTL